MRRCPSTGKKSVEEENMPEDTLIALILTIVLTVAVVAIIIAEVVWISKTHKKY